MILLPRGNPVKEKIDPGKIVLPEALRKLSDGSFTGYLRFDTPTGTGILIFEQGRLISALFEGAKQQLVAAEALTEIFETSLAGGANLDIFRLSRELALSIHALLHGHVLYRGQELKLIDIKALLLKLKEERISGCLRIYTDEHVALIFYRDGSPLGFFHDGSTDIETTADTSMSVARQPGAKIDVLTTSAADETVLTDLLASIDLQALWEREVAKLTSLRRQQQEEQVRDRAAQLQQRRVQVQGVLRSAAERHLGKIGGSLVDKEFERLPGSLDATALDGLYSALAKAAKLVAGPSKIEQMLVEMKKGARALLSP